MLCAVDIAYEDRARPCGGSMKHNEHVMTWLRSLRDEAVDPACSIARMIDVMAILARYSFGRGTV
ncbi:hypothetical protein GCM10017624_45500 [Azotobacter vinelandii]|nr:hypothetical protein GCM10017624_45500 [Azotobacter vinelandii]